MLVINSNNPLINKKRISTFEKEHNIKLPNDYIDFLIKYNGGSLENNNIAINEFLGIDASPINDEDVTHINDLELHYKNYNKDYPFKCLPIARLEGGN